jgi:hypothetical protein
LDTYTALSAAWNLLSYYFSGPKAVIDPTLRQFYLLISTAKKLSHPSLPIPKHNLPSHPLPMDQHLDPHLQHPQHPSTPYVEDYNPAIFHLQSVAQTPDSQFPSVKSQEPYIPFTQVDESQQRLLSSVASQVIPDINIIDTSINNFTLFIMPESALSGSSTGEADSYWKAIFAPIRSAWKDFITSIQQLIKNGHPHKDTLELCLHNIEMNLTRIPTMFSVKDRRLLQELLNRVRPEGVEAMRELKECLGHYAGNNIESIRNVINLLLESLKTKNSFLAFYDEPLSPSGTGHITHPVGLPNDCLLIRRRNGDVDSSEGRAADFGYKVLRCSNVQCKYCTHKTKKQGVEYWRTRQDVMTHLLSILLGKQHNTWICPACPFRSKPFSTKEVLRHHLTNVHHISTSRGKRHQDITTTTTELDSAAQGRQASSSLHRRSNSYSRYNPLERPPTPNPSSSHLAPDSSSTHHQRGRSPSRSLERDPERDPSTGPGYRILHDGRGDRPAFMTVPTMGLHMDPNSYQRSYAQILTPGPASFVPPFLNTATGQAMPSPESRFFSPTDDDLSVLLLNGLSTPSNMQRINVQPSHHPFLDHPISGGNNRQESRATVATTISGAKSSSSELGLNTHGVNSTRKYHGRSNSFMLRMLTK